MSKENWHMDSFVECLKDNFNYEKRINNRCCCNTAIVVLNERRNGVSKGN